MSPGYSLRSGGYSLRSKGSSPIQNRFPDPPKSRSMRKVPLRVKAPSPPSPSTERLSEAINENIDPEEQRKRYEHYLDTTRNRKPFKCSWASVKPAIRKEKTKAEAITITDPEEYFFGKHEKMQKLSQDLAAEAILYLEKTGYKWELVKPCMYEGDSISTCFMLHVNFQAKRMDDPEHPVQTFFAQVRYHQKHLLFQVDCCVSLGPSDSLPERRENEGCLFCSKYVHHPRGGRGGWSNGWPKWESSKKK